MGSHKKSSLIKFLSKITGDVKKLLGVLFTIGTVAGVIVASYKYISGPAERIQAILGALNFIVLAIYCLGYRTAPRLNLEKGLNDIPDKYCELFKDSPIKGAQQAFDKAKRKETRVNLSVKQLHTNIRWYAIFLIVVYVVYVFDNKTVLEGMLHLRQGFYEACHPYFSMAVGIGNYLSAVFIFLAFKVLYGTTIDIDDVTTIFYYEAELVVSIIIILAYISISASIATVPEVKTGQAPIETLRAIKGSIQNYENEIKKQQEKKTGASEAGNKLPPVLPQSANTNWLDPFYEQKKSMAAFDRENYPSAPAELDKVKDLIAPLETRADELWLNRLQLFIGSLNGLAMTLLFGRYVSMEQTAYDLKTGNYAEWEYKNIIHVCTICILPIYAIAQPLFGLFEIRAFGEPHAFANFVFFVCLIGKIFFLYLTYLLMKHRLAHLYMHSVITRHGVPEDIVECFDSKF